VLYVLFSGKELKMKQCPECNELFDDQKAFCDIDGSALTRANVAASGSSSAWVTGAIGGFVGVIICMLLYILFLAPNQSNLQDQEQRATQTKEPSSSRPSQVAAAPAQLTAQLPAETPTPAETESPEELAPTATESPVAPPPAPPAALNNGPIATGDKTALAGGERAIIKMKDGSSVEVDAAWEDSQGIWFRRSGLVSFVDRSRVEAITEPPQRRPATPEVKTP
jgi:hypothetical protein